MKILCLADLHGNLPPVKEKVDIIVVGGDICPLRDHHPLTQMKWLDNEFNKWLEEVSVPVVVVAGNHDFIFHKAPHLVPRLKWHYLEDQLVEVLGVKIYGSPWQLDFWGAFNLPERKLAQQWDKIPENIDILLLHGPPYGHGDLAQGVVQEEKWPELEHVGSPSLLERIKQVKPKLVVYGHIHPGYGRYDIDGITLVNASLVDHKYVPVNEPIVVEI